MIVFILGTGRCGTTLLEEVVCRHPEAAFVSNIDDRLSGFKTKGRWNNGVYRRLPFALTLNEVVRFTPSEGYRVLDVQVSPILSTPDRDVTDCDVTPWLERRVRRFFEDRLAAQRKPVLIHKFTGWPRALFLQRIFPDARFVNVVRDGRAVANSIIQMPWWTGYTRTPIVPLPEAYAAEWEAAGRSFPLRGALEWKTLIDRYELVAPRIGDAWLDVRYEDLLADRHGVINRVLEHAGLPPDRGFDRQVARYSLSPGRARAYEKDLGPETVDLLTRSLKDHLARWNYD